MTTVALIPARGGSKGVPGKNLRRIGGRSLVTRAIESARLSGVADHIVVSTDCDYIAEEARNCGLDIPFMRPDELAQDTTPIGPVIDHAISSIENLIQNPITTLIYLEATVPFRTGIHVRKAFDRFQEGDCGSVITVCPLERKPENIFEKIRDGEVEKYIKLPDEKFSTRQEMDNLCRISSGAYVIGRDTYMEARELIVPPIGYVSMTNMESINIDEELDVLLAETISSKYAW